MLIDFFNSSRCLFSSPPLAIICAPSSSWASSFQCCLTPPGSVVDSSFLRYRVQLFPVDLVASCACSALNSFSRPRHLALHNLSGYTSGYVARPATKWRWTCPPSCLLPNSSAIPHEVVTNLVGFLTTVIAPPNSSRVIPNLHMSGLIWMNPLSCVKGCKAGNPFDVAPNKCSFRNRRRFSMTQNSMCSTASFHALRRIFSCVAFPRHFASLIFCNDENAVHGGGGGGAADDELWLISLYRFPRSTLLFREVPTNLQIHRLAGLYVTFLACPRDPQCLCCRCPFRGLIAVIHLHVVLEDHGILAGLVILDHDIVVLLLLRCALLAMR